MKNYCYLPTKSTLVGHEVEEEESGTYQFEGTYHGKEALFKGLYRLSRDQAGVPPRVAVKCVYMLTRNGFDLVELTPEFTQSDLDRLGDIILRDMRAGT